MNWNNHTFKNPVSLTLNKPKEKFQVYSVLKMLWELKKKKNRELRRMFNLLNITNGL